MKNISECEPGSPPSAMPRHGIGHIENDMSELTKPNRKAYSSKIRRKITLCDAEAVAKRIVRTRCTEKEAIIVLGFNYESWRTWKDRHKNSPLFDSIVTRIRETRVEHLIQDIEDIGDGIGMKQPDWRAKQFVLQVTAPHRFVLNNPQPATIDAANAAITDAMRRAFAGPVIDVNAEMVSEQSNNNQTPIKALSAPLRPIPPRKVKLNT